MCNSLELVNKHFNFNCSLLFGLLSLINWVLTRKTKTNNNDNDNFIQVPYILSTVLLIGDTK